MSVKKVVDKDREGVRVLNMDGRRVCLLGRLKLLKLLVDRAVECGKVAIKVGREPTTKSR